MDVEMRQSEGNIYEVTGHQRRQQNDLKNYGLDSHDLTALSSKLRRLQMKDSQQAEGDGPTETQLAGKKRLRGEGSDSFVSVENEDAELGEEDYFYGETQGHLHNGIVKLNEEEELEMIRELENEAIGNDPLKELDEALKDRATAQKTLRGKNQIMPSHLKVNSSNFVKGSQEPAAAIKKLKEFKNLKQRTAFPSLLATPTATKFITATKKWTHETQEESKMKTMTVESGTTRPFQAENSSSHFVTPNAQRLDDAAKARFTAATLEVKNPVTDFCDIPMTHDGDSENAVPVSSSPQSTEAYHNKFNTGMKKK